MTEDLDKWHVLITCIVSFFMGAGAVYLRLWLLRREVQRLKNKLYSMGKDPYDERY
jgi:NADH:ubiquinone oxidoreductase subunit 3 (subunit A)